MVARDRHPVHPSASHHEVLNTSLNMETSLDSCEANEITRELP